MRNVSIRGWQWGALVALPVLLTLTLDVRASAAATSWAILDFDGSFLDGKGAEANFRLGVGSYQVVFRRPVTRCAVSATIHTGAGPGMVRVEKTGPRTVAILTDDPDGNPADRAVLLAVHC